MFEVAASETGVDISIANAYFLCRRHRRAIGGADLDAETFKRRRRIHQLKLKQWRLADGGRRLVYIGHARKLHHEPVLSSADNTPFLHLHDRLRDAKCVDTRLYHIPQDAHRAGDLRALYSRDIRFIHQTASARKVEPELELILVAVVRRRIDEIPDQNAEYEHHERPKDEYGVRRFLFYSRTLYHITPLL